MERILEALLRAFGSLLHPRMLWLMVWPVAVAVVVWVALAVLYWGQVLSWVDVQLHQYAAYEWLVSIRPFRFVTAWLGWLLLLFCFVPLVQMTAVLIIGVAAMPAMVDYVAARDYPALARRKGGSFVASLRNALLAVVQFVLIGVVSLPFWLFPLLWPVLPVLLLGWFNQSVYRYDALAEHSTPDEIVEVIRRHRAELFVLGVVLAVVGHVPLVGLLMPVYGGLAFIHFGLGRLRELRSDPIEGSAVRIPE
jgi:CysZ protein